jgi:hypothetical protein
MTLEEFGLRLGYTSSARKGAFQLLNYTSDPRLSTVEKAAAALGCEVADLLSACPADSDGG